MVEQPESNELASSGARAKQMPEIFKTQQLQSKVRARRLLQGPELDSVWLQVRTELVLTFFHWNGAGRAEPEVFVGAGGLGIEEQMAHAQVFWQI